MYEQRCTEDPFTTMVRASIRGYSELVRVWVDIVGGFAYMLPAVGEPGGRAVATGKVGTKAQSVVTIRNTEFRSVRFRMHAVTATLRGPGGAEIETTLAVEPSEFVLGPWQSRSVKLSAGVTEEMALGSEYVADVEAWALRQTLELVVRPVS